MWFVWQRVSRAQLSMRTASLAAICSWQCIRGLSSGFLSPQSGLEARQPAPFLDGPWASPLLSSQHKSQKAHIAYRTAQHPAGLHLDLWCGLTCQIRLSSNLSNLHSVATKLKKADLKLHAMQVVPRLTYVMLALNLLVYGTGLGILFIEGADSEQNYFFSLAKVNEAVAHGEYYRWVRAFSSGLKLATLSLVKQALLGP